MGWSSGGDIFDPVADELIEEVVSGQCTSAAATRVLEVLIRGLLDRDWDTEGESLGEYWGVPFVVEAFKSASPRTVESHIRYMNDEDY